MLETRERPALTLMTLLFHAVVNGEVRRPFAIARNAPPDAQAMRESRSSRGAAFPHAVVDHDQIGRHLGARLCIFPRHDVTHDGLRYHRCGRHRAASRERRASRTDGPIGLDARGCAPRCIGASPRTLVPRARRPGAPASRRPVARPLPLEGRQVIRKLCKCSRLDV